MVILTRLKVKGLNALPRALADARTFETSLVKSIMPSFSKGDSARRPVRAFIPELADRLWALTIKDFQTLVEPQFWSRFDWRPGEAQTPLLVWMKEYTAGGKGSLAATKSDLAALASEPLLARLTAQGKLTDRLSEIDLHIRAGVENVLNTSPLFNVAPS